MRNIKISIKENKEQATVFEKDAAEMLKEIFATYSKNPSAMLQKINHSSSMLSLLEKLYTQTTNKEIYI